MISAATHDMNNTNRSMWKFGHEKWKLDRLLMAAMDDLNIIQKAR